jgi:hypothetical protein
MQCTHCGAQISPTAKFCHTCGKPVASTESTDAATPLNALNGIDTVAANNTVAPAEPDLATSEKPATGLIGLEAEEASEAATANGPKSPQTASKLFLREPPASVVNQQPASHAHTITAMIAIIVVVLIISLGGWAAWRTFGRGVAFTNKVDTSCYSLKLPSKIVVNTNTGNVCSFDANSYETTVTAELLPAGASEANLQQYATRDGKTAKSFTFANEPAYRVDTTIHGRPSAIIYVYNRSSTISVDGKKYHGYAITFGSTQDVAKLVDETSQSWQWKTPDSTEATLTGYVPLADGNTSCYEVLLPPGGRAYGIGECDTRITYGQQAFGSMQIRDLVGDYPNLKSYVDSWKKYQGNDVKIVTETDFKLDGYDAHKVVYSYNSSSIQRAAFFVFTGPTYASVGIQSGFEVDASYDLAGGEPAIVDSVINSWQWK